MNSQQSQSSNPVLPAHLCRFLQGQIEGKSEAALEVQQEDGTEAILLLRRVASNADLVDVHIYRAA